METQSTPRTTSQTLRLHYLDWLRVLAIFMVFLFHSVHVFDFGDWSIKNAEQSEVITIILALLAIWGMPFFFLVAGTSGSFALQRRAPSQYLRERTKRLLIPFIVGTLLFWLPMVYLEWSNKVQLGIWKMSFQEYLGTFPNYYANLGLSPLWLAFGKHMWFLGFLFAFAVITLPLLLWLKRGGGARWQEWLAQASEHRGGILLLAVPLIAVRLCLQPFFPTEHGWSDFVFEMGFFVLGFVLFADERFARAIRRDAWLLFTTGTVALLALVGLYGAEVPILEWQATPTIPQFYLIHAVISLIAFCYCLVMLWVGMRWLDFTNRLLVYGQEAVLPFFMLHQPVIIAIAFFVVQWPMDILPKLLTVVVSSFIVTMGLYDLVVRPFAPIRALFGMTSSPPKKPQLKMQAG